MDFYHYESKEPHKRGRRFYKYEEDLHRMQATNTFMQKFLVDPKKQLSEKRKMELMNDDSDGMLIGVLYSVNKHGRWKITNADQLLHGKQQRDVDVTFVDHAYTLYCYSSNDCATSVALLEENGSITTSNTERCTSMDKNLLHNAAAKAKRQLTNPRLEYIVHTVHPSPTKFRKDYTWNGRRSRFDYGNYNTRIEPGEKCVDDRYYCGCKRTRHRCYLKTLGGELESEAEEENEEKEEKKREYRLILEDCIRHSPIRQRAKKTKRRRQSTDSDYEIIEKWHIDSEE